MGDVVMTVSALRYRTFDEFTHNALGRWAVHEVVNHKPKAEFIGPGQNEITMIAQVARWLGVDPIEEYSKIGVMILEGRHFPLFIGEQKIGNGEWYVESNESVFKYINSAGVIQYIEMNTQLKEYF